MDDRTSWWQQVLVSLAALLVVGALIGAVVGFVGVKAAEFAGIGTSVGPTSGRDQRPLIPRNAGTPSSRDSSPPSSSSAPPSSARPPHRQHRTGITLHVSPTSASTYERVNLTGTWPGHEGVTLQVQRLENGAWVDFPTTATVVAGAFSTYIETGHVGLNRLRMYDKSSGHASNVGTVTIS